MKSILIQRHNQNTMKSERAYRYIHRTQHQLYLKMNAIRILQKGQRDVRVYRRERQRHINQIKAEAMLLQDQRTLQRVQELMQFIV